MLYPGKAISELNMNQELKCPTFILKSMFSQVSLKKYKHSLIITFKEIFSLSLAFFHKNVFYHYFVRSLIWIKLVRKLHTQMAHDLIINLYILIHIDL